LGILGREYLISFENCDLFPNPISSSTFDRNANIVLVNARIREAVDKYYTDSKEAGVYVIRGDNVVMMGDVDPKLESRLEPVTKEVLQKKAKELKAEGKPTALKVLEDD